MKLVTLRRKGRWSASIAVLLLAAVSYVPAARADDVVYLQRSNDGRYLVTIDNNGRKVTLASMDSITAPALSPDSQRVAFSGAIGDGSLGRYGIYVVGANGGGLTQLTNGDFGEFDPVWVNNGNTIVFSQNTSGSITGSCCRLASVSAGGGSVQALTSNIGAQRPSASPNGSHIFFDNGNAVYRIPAGGGSPVSVTSLGFDPAVSDNESEVVFLRRTGSGTMQLRRTGISGGSSTPLYTTPNQLENPVWVGDRIYFVEHGGLGYDGRNSVRIRSISRTGQSLRTERTLTSRAVEVKAGPNSDEMLFYRSNGQYSYFPTTSDGDLGSAIRAGNDYTSNWASITSVNVDGDGNDEIFFYREDGLYRYYQIGATAAIGAPITAGDDYTTGWSSVSAVDLDGDGQDEMFFYREDGLYRYYNIRPDGRIGSPITAGDDYTTGWSSVTAIDLDGDGQDEMFFYREDGLYRYYNIRANGRIGSPINAGDDYTTGWSAITAVDLERDGKDEMFFYRDDGLYRYYNVKADGRIGTAISQGDDYSTNWTNITSMKLPSG